METHFRQLANRAAVYLSTYAPRANDDAGRGETWTRGVESKNRTWNTAGK